MPATQPRLFPNMQRMLEQLGERLRLARLRRKYSIATVCARADIARATLYRAEAGDPAVSLGTYARILDVLGLIGDLDAVAADDVLGRKLQDLKLPAKRIRKARSPKEDSNDSEQSPPA